MARKTAIKPTSARSAVVAEREPEIGTGVAALLFFIIALLYFFPAFLPGRHIYGSDYIEAGYMMYEFARERIAAGELPKWVPYIYGGLPMFANPGSVFYPVRLLTNVLFPGTWSLPIILIVQFGIAGWGMYLLARELGCRSWVSFLAGLAFQLTGITISAVHAGHDGRIIVATFAPLFLFFLHRGIRTGAVVPFVGAAATLGFSLLSFQIQTNYYLLLAAVAWALFALIHLGIVRTPRPLARRVALGLGAVAFGFAVAAVNFLPFREYVADSPRGEARGYEYSTTWSLPPADAVGALIPERVGFFGDYKGKNPFKLNTEYVGTFVIIMLVLGFAVARRSRYWWFFLALGLITLTIAFGGHTPLYRLYYEYLPGTKRFRAPSVSFFLVALALAAMAALTLERIAQLRAEARQTAATLRGRAARNTLTWLIAGIAGATVLSALIASVVDGPGTSATATGFGRVAIFTFFNCLALWLWWTAGLRTLGFAALVAVITIADLLTVNRRFFSTIAGPDVVFAEDGLIRYLRSDPVPGRTWILPMAGGNQSNVLMLFDVEQAGGEHGNQLQRYNEFAGVGETVYVDWSNFEEHSNFVNAANVRYMVSRVDLDLKGADTLVLKERFRGGGWVYENLKALPRAYLVERAVTTPDTMAALTELRAPEFDIRKAAVVYTSDQLALPDTPLEGTARVVEHSPDRVVVRAEASRPALLVLADNWHKDWKATVNGKDTPILRTNHTFRGVVVGAGINDVVFEFEPRALYIGFYIYVVCLALLSGYAVWLIVAHFRRRNVTAA